MSRQRWPAFCASRLAATGVVGLALLIATAGVRADSATDCNRNSDLDVAIRGCSELIGRNPSDSGAYYNRGSAYLEKGILEFAAADLDRAIQLNPRDAEAYSKAIEFNPRYARAWRNRGDIYLAQGSKERAIAEYRKALEIDPAYLPAHDALKRMGVEP